MVVFQRFICQKIELEVGTNNLLPYKLVADTRLFILKPLKCFLSRKTKEYLYREKRICTDAFLLENVQEYKHSLMISNFTMRILQMVIKWSEMPFQLCLHIMLQRV